MKGRALATVVFFGLLAAACGEEEISQSPNRGKKVREDGTVASAAPARSAAPGGGVASKTAGSLLGGGEPDAGSDARPPEFVDHEWVESERSRDPFRSFEALFVEEARGLVQSQREVILDQYSIDELHLIGIVTRLLPERAMVVDPTGKGHVIQRGQLIGKAERVQIAGQNARSFDINWRVDQVREGDVVLVREDPLNPDVPSITRVIALRPEAEEALELP